LFPRGKEHSVVEHPYPPAHGAGEQGALDVALATGPGADAVVNLLGRAAHSGGV
jgi:hypothetical protein